VIICEDGNVVIGATPSFSSYTKAPGTAPSLIHSNTIYLIGRTEGSKMEEWDVDDGTSCLPVKHMDCADLLLDALEESTFLSKEVKDTAVKRVFTNTASFQNEALVERYCDHPAITPEAMLKD
jgi:hypothetical protein